MGNFICTVPPQLDNGYHRCLHCEATWFAGEKIDHEGGCPANIVSASVSSLLRHLATKLTTKDAEIARLQNLAVVGCETFEAEGVDGDEIIALCAQTIKTLEAANHPKAARAADAIRFVLKTYGRDEELVAKLETEVESCRLALTNIRAIAEGDESADDMDADQAFEDIANVCAAVLDEPAGESTAEATS